MSSVRLAPSVLVPTPPPGAAEASTAAVDPRPGAPGVTGAPSTAPLASWVSVGTHPSWLPEMTPGGVVFAWKSVDCPDTDQPGKVFRVSATVIALVGAVAVEPDPV